MRANSYRLPEVVPEVEYTNKKVRQCLRSMAATGRLQQNLKPLPFQM